MTDLPPSLSLFLLSPHFCAGAKVREKRLLTAIAYGILIGIPKLIKSGYTPGYTPG